MTNVKSNVVTLKELYEWRKGQPQSKGVVVLDGDWLVFQAMSAAEFDASWEEEIWHRCCDHTKAREYLESSIKTYLTRKKGWAGADVVLAFTDSINWRKELVDPTYKENRKVTKKPVGYFEFLESVFTNDAYICIREDMLEGDDVMGIIGSGHKEFGYGKAVLVSCDKDFKTIPDVDFLWCTTGNILVQTRETADFWHLYQTIKGDLTDGYSGIAGWGDAAEGFLKEPYFTEPETYILKSGKNKGNEATKWVTKERGDRTLWECILSIGAKAGMSPEDVLAQARMARILRFEEYNFIDKEIYLWEPASLNTSSF
ncbi:5'-3' exonuclease [Pectobacterium phage PP47]|uniref:5'-3' exonuclease n=2 Tax=Pektosvirus TaxID=2732689 RepID=A0A1L7DRZ6_9CAUD|nr:5'-3' exonuclease [Pectobacterium phage PP81]YP_009788731.1 5'-3' exonuclease [Pectobacterium phage PP47]APU03052.1 5'-3' exonuclease [Pectobacterium phage PP81]APW79770.1 5'-3' exonuclease [Pectobacterium phage PP47]